MNDTSLTIIKPENLSAIIQSAPSALQDNRASHQRCLQACQQLFQTIQEKGMTDTLDQQAATFIERSRRTLRLMNDRRSAVTKLFDEIRTAYTTVENDIDPTRPGTLPYLLQQQRDQYAALKRREAEQRQREEAARQRREAERNKFLTDIEQAIQRSLDNYLQQALHNLSTLDADITLDNYEQSAQRIIDTPCEFVLPSDFLPNIRHTVVKPDHIAEQWAHQQEQAIIQRVVPTFQAHFTSEVCRHRDEILSHLPSKCRELKAIAEASAEEAKRLQAEKQAREQAEAERRAEEEKKRQQQLQEQQEQQRQQQQVQALFAEQAAIQQYQPRAKVTKKIHLLNAEGILPVLSLWFAREGCNMTPDELQKKFRFAITFCEKLANKEDVTIKDENIEYIEQVKAK